LLVKIVTQLAPHASTVQKLNQMLMTQLRGRFTLLIQSPIALSATRNPNPT